MTIGATRVMTRRIPGRKSRAATGTPTPWCFAATLAYSNALLCANCKSALSERKRAKLQPAASSVKTKAPKSALPTAVAKPTFLLSPTGMPPRFKTA
jgi:hypothetical protein